MAFLQLSQVYSHLNNVIISDSLKTAIYTDVSHMRKIEDSKKFVRVKIS
jgi:hypothetical protein